MGGSSAGRTFRKPQRAPRTTSPRPLQTAQDWGLQPLGTAGNQAVARRLQGDAAPSTMTAQDGPSGESLEPATRLLMEARLGHDFSSVRVHTDQTAEQSARRVHAQAFTVGDDVVLASRDDSSRAWRLLLAHELAHVVQQHRGGGGPGPAHEAEAAAAARAVAAGRTSVVTLGAASGSIQCGDSASGAPTPPSWLAGVPARHVEGNIWEVEFRVGGPHYVGPYDELKAFVKKAGLTADAHHIVGGEHLKDLGSSFPYEKAPAVALDPGVHEKVITPRIGAEQRMVGGRRGGRVQLGADEVASMYRAAYTEQAPFKELARIAGNITRQSTAASAPVAEARVQVPSGKAPSAPAAGSMGKRGPGGLSGRGAAGAGLGGLLTAAGILAEPRLKQWFAENYLQEKWAAASRAMVEKAIAGSAWKYNVLILSRALDIQQARAQGREVKLHVVVDTDWVDTDFGPAQIGAEVVQYGLLFEGEIPVEWPVFQRGRGSWAEVFKQPRRTRHRDTYDFPL